MKLKHYTLKSNQINGKHLSQINDILKSVVDKKTDEYWKNYIDYTIYGQTAITIGLIGDDVKCFSSIYNRDFYGEGVYRLFNRFLVSDDIRETGGTKTYNGQHRFFDMLYQQINYVKTLKPKFYFISRQRKNTRWMKWYYDRFNKNYNENMVVSDKQYWICKGDEYGCCQTLIYPKDKNIPFKLYKYNQGE
tara:strand:- start:4660 stop:5232 length:573 start_codon:yes stop_codon:yes gene_type:complete